jgi:hypothetical protein
LFSPEAVFLFTITNKVYGKAPNELPLKEFDTRFDYPEPADHEGISKIAASTTRSIPSSAHRKSLSTSWRRSTAAATPCTWEFFAAAA